MTAVSVLPLAGQALLDARHDGRMLRLNWHADLDLYVLSIWRDERCVATFQLPRSEMPTLIDALVRSVAVEATAAPVILTAPDSPMWWTPATYTQLPSRRDQLTHRAKARVNRLRARLSG